jgi:hypothetical protein
MHGHISQAGAWEFDRMSGQVRVTLGGDGRLKGVIKLRPFAPFG